MGLNTVSACMLNALLVASAIRSHCAENTIIRDNNDCCSRLCSHTKLLKEVYTSKVPRNKLGGTNKMQSSFKPSLDPFYERRLQMITSQLEARSIQDTRVLNAMRTVPRHLFVPLEDQEESYDDTALSIGFGQTISQPYIVGLMCEAAQLTDQDHVLDIGTGSGYQAAVLSLLAKEVYAIEIIEPLGKMAQERLKEIGYYNVHVRIGDGYAGWPEQAPYDAILVAAAVTETPQPLLEQLKMGGRLIIPLGKSDDAQLVRITRTSEGFKKEFLLPVRFVPFTRKSN